MDRSLSVWHFHAIKISKQGNRERKRREREKEKLKGMRMLLAFIALLSHPWHEQQLVCMVTSAFTWLWVLSREKMVHFEKKVIPSVKLRVMFCFRSICMEELFPSRFLYKGLYYNKEVAKNQSINATQTTQRIWSLQWASSLSSMADAQRPIYFPISCKGVCSQALGLFQSVLLSTLPMDNFIIRWYIRLIFFFFLFFSVYHYILVRPCWAHVKAASKMNEWWDQSVERASNGESGHAGNTGGTP